MQTYDTVSDAVNGLRERGYTIDFNLEANQIHCPGESLALAPADFEITEFYRFEGNSDPDDEAIVYAVESRSGAKGLLVTGFGISAEGIGEDMVQKLKIRQ
jgi:hypothetical protein